MRVLIDFYQADMYSQGISEEIVGKALKKYNIPRSRVVIMTKCFFGVDDQGNIPPPLSTGRQNAGDYLNRVGLSRRHILEAVDASVERLGTYIDVLQIHRLDREVPREEIMRALNDVVESGKVRYIGASSVCFTFNSPKKQTLIPFFLVDGRLGIPDPTEHCHSQWLAQVYLHAELPQSHCP